MEEMLKTTEYRIQTTSTTCKPTLSKKIKEIGEKEESWKMRQLPADCGHTLNTVETINSRCPDERNLFTVFTTVPRLSHPRLSTSKPWQRFPRDFPRNLVNHSPPVIFTLSWANLASHVENMWSCSCYKLRPTLVSFVDTVKITL